MSSITTNAKFFDITCASGRLPFSPSGAANSSLIYTTIVKGYKYNDHFSRLGEFCSHRNLSAVVKASSGNGGASPPNDDDGVSLGTMKLPMDTDIPKFETLLFQWANSLCQGANLPLPMPLKVDKIDGGARLGFITIGDGETEVLVYIDCLVIPAAANGSSSPMFRAIRNGPSKDQPPPGEPRIMRSLLGALQKSVEIARL